MSVGNGVGVSTNGLVYCVDTFNLKSYPSSATTSAIDNMGIATNEFGEDFFRLYGGVTVDSNNRYFTFDGVNDYIGVGDLSFLGTDFTSVTLDMWFNSSSITDYKNLIDFNGFNTCIRIEQYTAPGYFGAWKNGSGSARMSVSMNGSGDSFGIGGSFTGDLIENTWYNLIVTYNNTGQGVKIFLNGVKLIDEAITSPFVGYITDMRIGDGYDYSSRRFQGSIAYVALYTRAISDSEAYGNYNTLKWRFV